MTAQDLVSVGEDWLAAGQGKQPAATAEAGDEDALAADQRVRVIGVPVRLPGQAPEFAPGLRFQGDQVLGGKDQHRLFAAGDKACRAGVAGGVGAVGPDDTARAAMQRDACRAGVEDHKVAPHERRPREAPAGGLYTVAAQVALPEDGALRRVEAKDIAPFADREDAVAADGRSRARAALIPLRAERRGVSVLPNPPAGAGLEAPDGVLVVGVANRVRPAVADGDRGEARAD